MRILGRWLGYARTSSPRDLAKPYAVKAREALLREDLPKAIAYLDCGIRLAPQNLRLYLERGQILQYGMGNCAGALRDYRFVLRELEAQPNEALARECRDCMREMMEPGQG